VGVEAISCDLLDASACREVLPSVKADHVFYATWARHATETETVR
jgi:hypothetical protein